MPAALNHHRSTHFSPHNKLRQKSLFHFYFTVQFVQYRAGSTDLRTGSNNGEISGYTLDDKGDIDFPIIGTLHIAGMTKSQIAALVKKRLMEENLVNDPVVTVEFMNLYFSWAVHTPHHSV